MASESEMMADLAAADAAGDTQLAQHIAGLIKQQRPAAEESPGHKFASALSHIIPGVPGESEEAHVAQTQNAIGMATGMGMPEIPGVGKAVGWVADKVGSGLKSAANSLAARTLKGTAGDYKALGKGGIQDLGDFLLGRGAVKFGSSPQSVAERIPALTEETGAQLGKAVDALDQTGAQVSKRDLADRLFALRDEAAKAGPAAAPLVAKYEAAGNAVLNDAMTSGEPMLSFKQAEQWKRAYQAPINYAKANNTPLEMGSKEIASASRQGVEDAAEQAEPATAAAFKAAKKESGLAQEAAGIAKGAEGRREARGLVGPVAKGVSWTAAALSAMHGNIPGAAAALAAGPAMQAVATRAPAAAAVTFNKGAQFADKVAWLALTNPGSLGKYGAILGNIARTGGQDALAAHLFVIGQTDPTGSDELRKRAEAEQ